MVIPMAEGGLAVAAAIAGATMKAAGTLVKVSPEQFIEITNRFHEKGIIIVHSQKGTLTKTHVYVTGVHGIIFYCKTISKLPINIDVEAKSISLG